MGFALEAIRGRRAESFLPPDVAERVIASYDRVTRTGEIHEYRETFQLGDEPKYWDTTLVPLLGDDGRVAKIIGTSRNGTRQVTGGGLADRRGRARLQQSSHPHPRGA
ncbi:PAS domain-containing protein [Sphingomonas guangdongensis]|uniref:PAS domain-containing protein n=1 Tax=Sphingomonas guangdongensis TaxID=1141890 RepID=UPI000C7D854F